MTELTRCEHKVKLIVSTYCIIENFIINNSMVIVNDIYSSNSIIIDIMIGLVMKV